VLEFEPLGGAAELKLLDLRLVDDCEVGGLSGEILLLLLELERGLDGLVLALKLEDVAIGEAVPDAPAVPLDADMLHNPTRTSL
jgi:hypothetical protein